MKLLILSDLHFEFHRDGGKSFVSGLPKLDDVDICVLAGDIAVQDGIEEALSLFCNRYRHVIYVHGNHEFYGGTRESAIFHTEQACNRLKNLYWLDCSEVKIEGQRFLGAPLWFANKNNSWWHQMNDFHVIKGFQDWVYEENARAVEFLNDGIEIGDVVITHHMPSSKSIHKMYKGSQLNDFFVCDMEPLITEVQPKIWVHGHTHFSFDYDIGDTRVVCNPFGYVRKGENAGFDFNKIIEL